MTVNSWFTRVGAAYSNMDYALGKDFADLAAQGDTHTTSGYITQPLYKSRTFSLNAQLQFDDKRLNDDIHLLQVNNDKHSQVWTASLSGNSQDKWGGGGLNYFSLNYSNGQLNITDPSTAYGDSRTARTVHVSAQSDHRLRF